MTLAEKMINFRAVNRISQKKLAEMCGISLQTVNYVESGKQAPSRVTEAKIRMIVGKEEEDGAVNIED